MPYRPDLGELVPCNDPQAMAAAMLRVHDGYERFNPAAIATFAEAGYGEAAQIARWQAVYEARAPKGPDLIAHPLSTGSSA